MNQANSFFTKLKKVISNPKILLFRSKLSCYIPDRAYLSWAFERSIGRPLNLISPQSFNEKLQWLKLYDRNPLYIKLVDKYEVREYIKKTIGEQYLVPLIGVYDNVDEIEIWRLPNQFVLKCTHDSGNVIICRNKDSFNFIDAKRKLQKAQRRNFYYGGREWPYKNINPRIICEELLVEKDTIRQNYKDVEDYKFHCFNGVPTYCQVFFDRHIKMKTIYYDMNWVKQDISRPNIISYEGDIQKPPKFEIMKQIASKLSEGFPYVRIDLYNVDGRIYFGEITFFPASGFNPFVPDSWDRIWGDKIDLSSIKNKSVFEQC